MQVHATYKHKSLSGPLVTQFITKLILIQMFATFNRMPENIPGGIFS